MIEEFAARLLLDYLDARRNAIGLPDASQLAFLEPFSVATASGPRLESGRSTADWRSPSNPKVTVELQLCSIAWGDGRVESSTDAGWCAKIRRAIRDAAAWRTWLNALSGADRTGWQLLALPTLRGGSSEVDKDARLRERTTTVEFNFRVDV